LMERLFTNIMTLKSVLTSWATHERPWEWMATSSQQQGPITEPSRAGRRSSPGLLTVGCLQPPTAKHYNMESWPPPTAPRGPQLNLKPSSSSDFSSSEKSPPYEPASSLACPVLLLDSQVIHPYQEISYSLALSEINNTHL
jgi:hypothetical protein